MLERVEPEQNADDGPQWPELSTDFDAARSAARSAVVDHERARVDQFVGELVAQNEALAERLDALERSLVGELTSVRQHVGAQTGSETDGETEAEVEPSGSAIADLRDYFSARLDGLRADVDELRAAMAAHEERTGKLQAGVDAERAMRPTVADVTELGAALTDAIEQLEVRTNQAYALAVSATQSQKSSSADATQAPVPEATTIDLRDPAPERSRSE